MTLVAQASNHIAIGTECGIQGNLRSTADHDAANSVGEAIGEETGDVIVHDLHLAALELSHLVQADLVLLGVLLKAQETEGKTRCQGHYFPMSVRNYICFQPVA